jgi:hypothetical protein
MRRSNRFISTRGVSTLVAGLGALCIFSASEIAAQSPGVSGPPTKVNDNVQRKRDKLDENLRKRLGKAAKDEKIKVNVVFDAETVNGAYTATSGEVGVTKNENAAPEVKIKLNGKPAAAADLENLNRSLEQTGKSKHAAVQERNKAKRTKVAKQQGWEADPSFVGAQQAGYDVVTLNLTAAEIDKVVRESGADVVAIEEWVEPTTTVASAMPKTGVQTYGHAAGAKGAGVNIYMSETGCPNAGFVTGYTKLDASAPDSHNQNVVGILRAVAPSAAIYCRGGYALPTATDLATYPFHIATQSWGYTNYGGYNSGSSGWDDLAYNRGITVFFASGNTGSTKTCPLASDFVGAPSNGLNTIGVGAYDDANDSWAAFSCYGPSGAKTQKPEISAPGVNITAMGVTMSGTSQATPHAAAFMATISGTSGYTWLRGHPALMKAHVMAGARDAIVGGVDKVGVGGIDWLSEGYNWYGWWWEGANASFFDASNNVTTYLALDASIASARAVVTWLNRGSYTLAHIADTHPIGMDLDFSVYDPNGAYVGGSGSYDNSYEIAQFDPLITGTYKFVIKRYANRDTASDVRLGLVVDW